MISALIVGGIAVAGIALTPIIAGFGTAGIVAGSTAAAVQSSMGTVAAGSLFATLQSWGMLGYFTAGAGTGIGATILGLIFW